MIWLRKVEHCKTRHKEQFTSNSILNKKVIDYKSNIYIYNIYIQQFLKAHQKMEKIVKLGEIEIQKEKPYSPTYSIYFNKKCRF